MSEEHAAYHGGGVTLKVQAAFLKFGASLSSTRRFSKEDGTLYVALECIVN